MENILIVGAHYDDAELGVGGTAAKLVAEGKNVYKLTLTNNETNFKQMNITIDSNKSKDESSKACKIIGIKEIEDFIPEKCNELTYSKELMQRIEKVIFDYNIDTIFLHSDKDINQDHVAASQLCMTAGRHCDNIIQYQSNGYIFTNNYYPTYFVDISNYIELKKKALGQYVDGHDRFNRLFSTAIERNHIQGYANKTEYAEGFHIVKYLVK